VYNARLDDDPAETIAAPKPMDQASRRTQLRRRPDKLMFLDSKPLGNGRGKATDGSLMKLVSQYWRGVLRRLQAEVEDFNSLINHRGEQGRENELSIARMLENLIPARYGVGSGLLFDSDGNESSQTDIVLFDAVDEPAILAQTTQVLFPVENVRGAIEVKTNINGAELVDIGKKVGSVKALHPAVGKMPICAAVGYQATVLLDTVVTHFKTLKTATADNRPDLFLVVDPAMIGRSARIARNLGWDVPEPDDYILGVTPLQRDKDGQVTVGSYEPVPQGNSNSTGVLHHGNRFAVHSVSGVEYMADSARALLLFSEALITTLSIENNRSAPGFHYYITPEMRDLLLISLSQESS